MFSTQFHFTPEERRRRGGEKRDLLDPSPSSEPRALCLSFPPLTLASDSATASPARFFPAPVSTTRPAPHSHVRLLRLPRAPGFRSLGKHGPEVPCGVPHFAGALAGYCKRGRHVPFL
jgi:hypothetical protein